jgi:hypothetical protein
MTGDEVEQINPTLPVLTPHKLFQYRLEVLDKLVQNLKTLWLFPYLMPKPVDLERLTAAISRCCDILLNEHGQPLKKLPKKAA